MGLALRSLFINHRHSTFILVAELSPRPALLETLNTPEAKARLLANTEAAVARGVFGIPTFFIGDEMFFGKERVGQIEALLESQSKQRQRDKERGVMVPWEGTSSLNSPMH